MKIAIITDLHFGVRNDNPAILLHQKKFFSEQFIPYVADEKNQIGAVFCLGDTFDKRKQSNHLSVYEAKKSLFNPLAELDKPFYMVVGNHDAYFKNTIEINTPSLCLKEYKNIIVIDKPCEDLLDSQKVLFLPWICPDNWEATKKALHSTRAKICCAHLQLSGFEMYRGSPVSEGMPASLFEKFDMVLTGHYHHKSTKDNIHYLGTPYEMTWADYGDPRGFHVLDDNTMELEFHENMNHLFNVIEYNDKNYSSEKEMLHCLRCEENQFVKIRVTAKDHPDWLESLVSKLESNSPVECKVIENYNEADLESVQELEAGGDTLTFLLDTMKEFADNSTEEVLMKAQAKLKSLYLQAHDMVED